MLILCTHAFFYLFFKIIFIFQREEREREKEREREERREGERQGGREEGGERETPPPNTTGTAGSVRSQTKATWGGGIKK